MLRYNGMEELLVDDEISTSFFGLFYLFEFNQKQIIQPSEKKLEHNVNSPLLSAHILIQQISVTCELLVEWMCVFLHS